MERKKLRRFFRTTLAFMMLSAILMVWVGCENPNLDENGRPKAELDVGAATAESEEYREESLTKFSTQILDKERARLKNLKLAAGAINGHVIQAGAEFSFNEFAGERSKEKGYEKALVIVGKDKKYDYGGGVCQISSTIYNAAKQAELEILERHSHKAEIHYLPLGEDAAVEYGTLDLRFINNRETPLKINVEIGKDTVDVELMELYPE